MRLHVCRLRAIERANALYRKSLNHIDELAAPIIPFAGIAFRVFIRALRTLRRHHCRTGVIFRSNQLNMRFLPRSPEKRRLMFDKNPSAITQADPEVWSAIQQEERRQEAHIELIASENYASPAVMAAQGSQCTNKYAEGYPGKRYYGGCEFVDVVERLAIERVCALYGAEAANVQPHSGSQANQGVFFAMLKPGDTIMGMSLAHGGHLTHGSPVNLSGKWFNIVPYGLNEAEDLDYEAA